MDALKIRDPNFEVYMDGGVRKGTDVLKALALGARMVFVGRPAIWGLAYNGKDGVLKTLDILRKELDSVMSLSGNTDVLNIDKSVILAPNSVKGDFFSITPSNGTIKTNEVLFYHRPYSTCVLMWRCSCRLQKT